MNRREVFIIKKEEWKDIKGYEGYYQVSNLGRVKSIDRIVENNYNFATKDLTAKRLIKGKILKQHCTGGNKNYYQVTLNKPHQKPKQANVHKLVAEAFLSKKDFKCLPDEDKNEIQIDKLFINHKDENKLNNKANNLEWCTHKYNADYSNKLHPR